MALRVTQQMLYGTVINQNNASLARLMATNEQASTQKRINAPSDDPNGAVQVLGTRTDLSQLGQYQSNITSAKGWLNQADSTLSSTSTLITTIKSYAEQAATGTVTQENRNEIATQIRQYFGQLISLANTTYNGDSIFAGQKTNTAAYTQGLWMNSNDATFDAAVSASGGFAISGGSDETVLVQFMGTDPTNYQPAFQYSSDGGTTWNNGTYATAPGASSQTLNLGSGLTMDLDANALTNVTACADHNDSDGTWMWIRPTAVYQGNTNQDVTVFSVDTGGGTATASASGTFSGNVMVRMDDTSGPQYQYSYSTDGGTSWVTGNTSSNIGPPTTLAVPGGLLTITAGAPADGDQFFIQPSTADIPIGISPTDSVVVNGVGTEIFGGIDNNRAVTFSGSNAGNLFETVGKLVGYLETNNQHGIQNCLDDLTASQNQVLVAASSVGARENRVTSAGTMVTTLQENATSTLSNVEDADLTALITTLSEQELAYQAVLKSSSMVMDMSLVKYI
ncbi:flagellar hook-associated protein 3 [Solidesulfovibrio fructosivorans JJ]]|uniref:Flagellar hook-associated protein 3 n=1 Tax=Solidesulfovibrio fructosivorans JJ] TaxID=596151 RepID=E1JZC1_SOLFR|nr:flagellar hook-associated protein FlgL [Solidesulfovibrio fructosivorans]EFL50281.1 flagellar hook-associated protein 3 [Solidesulfovibrio fructosivorans JJ]]